MQRLASVTTAPMAVLPLMMALVLAACGASALEPASTTAQTAPTAPPAVTAAQPAAATAEATPAPTAAPASPAPVPSGPIVHGQAVEVHGTETCWTEGLVEPTPDADGRVMVRDASLTCEMTYDDPRVSGTKTGPYEFDAWGALDNGAMVQWAAKRHIETKDGAWDGWALGTYTSDAGDQIQAWFQGSGAYEGLVFVETISGLYPSGVYPVTGLIYPGTIPEPWATK
jgi:hypothetical protein